METQPRENTRGKIGPWKPHTPPRHTVYVGDDPLLKGKGALVGYTYVGGACVAQFDDLECGYAYGWHHFRNEDFKTGEA